LFLRVWQPQEVWEFPEAAGARQTPASPAVRAAGPGAAPPRAWVPWLFLSVTVILWGLAPTEAVLNGGPAGAGACRAGQKAVVSPALSPVWNVPLLHRFVFRDYPVVAARVDPARIAETEYRNQHAEAAQFTLNWASATGSAIFVASLVSAVYLG